MRLNKFLKSVGPVIAMAMAAGVAGCDGAKFSVNGTKGVPLAELDLSGKAPEEIALLGPDIVRITPGEDFTIALEGDTQAKERMRFLLQDGRLSVMRDASMMQDNNRATVTVTMPAPKRLVLAGSGNIFAEHLARTSEVTIVGSGMIETLGIDVDSLEAEIAGSGSYRASGVAKVLDLSIAGSGDADLAELKVANAEISIAGSGDASFASDGTVKAKIMGSGNVTVRGSATCKVQSLGSGSLRCERGAAQSTE
ncbi:head GIN domain-containing protein [Altererythrobacter fulvus]|uniref:head GIN domain-containing protein n=1 Tax=Caenibius fulvus TaxID=2126012 RepID=UPI00301A1345